MKWKRTLLDVLLPSVDVAPHLLYLSMTSEKHPTEVRTSRHVARVAALTTNAPSRISKLIGRSERAWLADAPLWKDAYHWTPFPRERANRERQEYTTEQTRCLHTLPAVHR